MVLLFIFVACTGECQFFMLNSKIDIIKIRFKTLAKIHTTLREQVCANSLRWMKSYDSKY